MEWTEVTLDTLKADCPPDVLRAYADELLTGFNARIEELEAEIQESAQAEPEPDNESAIVSEAETKLEARLAAVELRERQFDALDILRESLAEAQMTDAGKALVARRFADAAPEDKAAFKKTVTEEIKALSDHEKRIAESVRLPGTPGVLGEAADTEPIDVRAGIAKAAGVKPQDG